MKINFDKMQGLAPAIVQDEATGEVLMLGFMNRDALRMTRDSGYATFFSRTRGSLWTKGETSGNKLLVISILVDCDDDTLLLKVKRLGAGNVCHTGERSCFYRKFQ
jgi:phosphoribosyl-AMP cyclohydrolase